MAKARTLNKPAKKTVNIKKMSDAMRDYDIAGAEAQARTTVLLSRRPKGNDGKPVRVFLHHSIGHSGQNLRTRLIREDLVKNGWKWYRDQYIAPSLAYIAPIDGVVLHNPFGCLPHEDMQADQAIHAVEAGMARLVEDFAFDILPLALEREVIAYLGHLRGDREFSALASGKDAALYLARLLSSYGAVLSARCSIGFDVMTDIAPTHPAVHFMRLLQSLGTRCYAEPMPAAGDAHLADVPIIVMEDHWQRHHAGLWPSWALPRNQVKGEIVRVFNLWNFPGESWDKTLQRIIAWARQAWREGCSVAIPGTMPAELRRSVDELFGT